MERNTHKKSFHLNVLNAKAYSRILYKTYENRHDPVFPVRCHCGFLWVDIVQDRFLSCGQGRVLALVQGKVLNYEVFPKLQRLGTRGHNF